MFNGGILSVVRVEGDKVGTLIKFINRKGLEDVVEVESFVKPINIADN